MFLRPFGSKRAELERRFVQIHQIRAENRPKSRGKIWNRTKNVVPLHCQSEDRRAIKMRDTSGIRPPDVAGRNGV